jgi:hypothetical protein
VHKGFAGVESGARSALAGVSALKGAFGSLITVAAGLAGVASAFEAINKGIGQASERETAGQRFATVAGGIDKVRAATEKLEAASAETGTDFPELEKGAQRLMESGLTADQAADSIVRLNKVSLLTGNSLEELADIVARVQLKEEVSAKDMAKLAAAGVPGIASINQQFKGFERSVEASNQSLDAAEEKLRQFREAGAIDPESARVAESQIHAQRLANQKALTSAQQGLSSQVQQAFQKATDPGGALGNLNAYFATFAGKMHLVKHDIDETFEGFGKGLIDSLDPVLDKLHSQFMPAIKDIGEKFGQVMGNEVDMFFQAFQSGDWSAIQKQLNSVLETAGQVFADALTNPGTIQAVNALGNLLLDAALSFGKALASGAIDAITEVTKHIPGIAEAVGRETSEIFKGFSPEQKEKFYALQEKTGPGSDAANIYKIQLESDIRGHTEAIKKDFKDAGEAAAQVLGKIGQDLKLNLLNPLEAVKKVVAPAAGGAGVGGGGAAAAFGASAPLGAGVSAAFGPMAGKVEEPGAWTSGQALSALRARAQAAQAMFGGRGTEEGTRAYYRVFAEAASHKWGIPGKTGLQPWEYAPGWGIGPGGGLGGVMGQLGPGGTPPIGGTQAGGAGGDLAKDHSLQQILSALQRVYQVG